MPSIEFTYPVMKQIVPMIPVDAVNAMMKEFVPENDSNLVVLAFCNEAEGNVYPSKEQLLATQQPCQAPLVMRLQRRHPWS